MNIEKVVPLELDAKKAADYALSVAGEGLGKRAVRAKSLGGGSFGMAFVVTLSDGSEAVVKFLRADGMLEKETHDLALLAEHCGVRMPTVFFSRVRDDVVPVDSYVMDKIDGKTLLMDFPKLLCSKSAKLRFADEVTSALHGIHKCTADKFGDTMDPKYTTWTDCYEPFARGVLKKAEELASSGQLSQDIVEAMRRAWEKFGDIFSEPVGEACLIHGDLNVGNIMVGKGLNVTGFIDPLNSMYADREYDLFQFNNLTGKKFYLCETYAKKYGASKNFEQKLAFYGLWNEVYCFIKAGTLFPFIMNPLVKNMNAVLDRSF